MAVQLISKPLKNIMVERLLEVYVLCIKLFSLICILIDSVNIDYKCLQCILDTSCLFISCIDSSLIDPIYFGFANSDFYHSQQFPRSRFRIILEKFSRSFEKLVFLLTFQSFANKIFKHGLV